MKILLSYLAFSILFCCSANAMTANEFAQLNIPEYEIHLSQGLRFDKVVAQMSKYKIYDELKHYWNSYLEAVTLMKTRNPKKWGDFETLIEMSGLNAKNHAASISAENEQLNNAQINFFRGFFILRYSVDPVQWLTAVEHWDKFSAGLKMTVIEELDNTYDEGKENLELLFDILSKKQFDRLKQLKKCNKAYKRICRLHSEEKDCYVGGLEAFIADSIALDQWNKANGVKTGFWSMAPAFIGTKLGLGSLFN